MTPNEMIELAESFEESAEAQLLAEMEPGSWMRYELLKLSEEDCKQIAGALRTAAAQSS